MTSGIAVFDASPLIVFWQVNSLDLLRELFSQSIVPLAVAQEVAPSLGELPPWVGVQRVPTTARFPGNLDRGERESLALAMTLSADFVVLDDLPGRRAASGQGLTVIGSLGLLVRAKDYGLVTSVRPTMDLMIASGLYATEKLYHEILEAAGESEL